MCLCEQTGTMGGKMQTVQKVCVWGGGDLESAATPMDSSKEMSFLCLTPESRTGISVRGHTEASGTRLLGSQANSATDSLCDLGHDI